jgi:transcriptional repressor NrdR
MKRDGHREPFDPVKVRRGVENAVADRPVPADAVDALVRSIESEVGAGSGVVRAEDIGLAVLTGLRRIDEVAYLRFASVYKDFQGAEDFEREMAALEGEA